MELSRLQRYGALAMVLFVIGGVIYYLEPARSRPSGGEGDSGNDLAPRIDLSGVGADSDVSGAERETIEAKAAKYEVAKEVSSPDAFINTDGITVKELIGKKVVLIDFWTYSCINCQRTTPYLNAWYEKYRDQGLEIIGVHTPEFEFEKKLENVAAAVKKFGIKYPVALDNDYSTWKSYRNNYWPRKYLIDIDGFVVYNHIGEGAYEETERIIQRLLAERRKILGEGGGIATGVVRPQDAPRVDFSQPMSRETYFGSLRNTNFANGSPGISGTQTFILPESFEPHRLYLGGVWELQPEYAQTKEGKAKIVFRYTAKDVYMVASGGSGVTLTIFRDGKPVGSAGGADVKNGVVPVSEDRLYHIISNPEGYGEHTLEIIVENPGLKVFTFTFG